MTRGRVTRLLAVALGMVALSAVLAIGIPRTTQAADGRIVNVPADQPTLEAAIAAAQPGDVIVLAAGTYPGDVVVPEDRPGITIRGIDRNTVVFDGEHIRRNAIEVEADGVTLENMTAHSYVDNGFYWDGVEGFAGRYLTVWNVRLYGIYAIESRDGVMEHSYVSGAGDAAFYIGECYPCDAVLRNLTATLSAVGYSGTNAGGNLVVEDSVFESNAVGILPNSYDVGLEPPPQREATFRRNIVRGSGSVPTPRQTPLGGFHGIGIGITGGVDNVIESNEVTGSARYGIVLVATVDRNTTFSVSGNQVRNNRVSGSGTADIALAASSGANNCFEGNEAAVVDPPEIAGGCAAAGSGSEAVASVLMLPPPALLEGLPEAPPYSDMPPPPPQPGMVVAVTPLFGVDLPPILLVAVLVVLLLLAGVALGVRRRRRV